MRNAYRFESELSPEEIMDKLSATARFACKGWRLTSNTLFYEITNDSLFMLIYTGSAGASGGQLPFFGEVEEKDGKTVITGQFKPSKEQRKMFGFFCLIPIALLLIIDYSMFLTAFPFYLIWIFLGYSLLWNSAPRSWRKNRDYVINYIKEYLLK